MGCAKYQINGGHWIRILSRFCPLRLLQRHHGTDELHTLTGVLLFFLWLGQRFHAWWIRSRQSEHQLFLRRFHVFLDWSGSLRHSDNADWFVIQRRDFQRFRWIVVKMDATCRFLKHCFFFIIWIYKETLGGGSPFVFCSPLWFELPSCSCCSCFTRDRALLLPFVVAFLFGAARAISWIYWWSLK